MCVCVCRVGGCFNTYVRSCWRACACEREYAVSLSLCILDIFQTHFNYFYVRTAYEIHIYMGTLFVTFFPISLYCNQTNTIINILSPYHFHGFMKGNEHLLILQMYWFFFSYNCTLHCGPTIHTNGSLFPPTTSSAYLLTDQFN